MIEGMPKAPAGYKWSLSNEFRSVPFLNMYTYDEDRPDFSTYIYRGDQNGLGWADITDADIIRAANGLIVKYNDANNFEKLKYRLIKSVEESNE